MFPKRRRNKYNNQRTGEFDSGLEASVHALLLLRERNGEISDIKRQQSIVLQDGPRSERITWRVDFTFVKKGILWLCEAKGFEDATYKLKLKLYRGAVRRGEITSPLEIWKGSAARPCLVEEIIPKNLEVA